MFFFIVKRDLRESKAYCLYRTVEKGSLTVS